MAKVKEPFNPFYVLVIVLGVAFAVTTFAYGTMAYRAVAPQPGEGANNFMDLVDQHGVTAMIVELILLGIATAGAIWLDSYRSKRKTQQTGIEE